MIFNKTLDEILGLELPTKSWATPHSSKIKYEYDDGGSYMFVKKSKGLIFYHIRNCVIIKFVPENTPTHESRHPLTIITSMSTLTVRQPHT